MAHQLKYYKEIESHGHLWRVEFLQETEDVLTPMEIGPVLQSLRLVLQGDQADIDTPIVKTSLEMSFIDAPDLDDDRKCGYWEEFYTSSSTEYMVCLYKDGEKEWSGYVTPDSFAEDLRYRGSVSIIVRDGLGALQDYMCLPVGDENGMITFRELISQSWNVLPMAMELEWFDSPYINKIVNNDTGVLLEDALFNTNSFHEKNWYEALEETLYATGYAMRYSHNKFIISPIRYIGLLGNEYWWDIEYRNTKFISYGHRELNPAVKSIQTDAEFDIVQDITDTSTREGDYGEETTYRYGSAYVGVLENMPVHSIVGGVFKGTGVDNTILLNAFKYPIARGFNYGTGGEIHDINTLYVAANLTGGSEYREKHKMAFYIDLKPGEYRIALEINKIIAFYNNKTEIGYARYPKGTSWTAAYGAKFTDINGNVKQLTNRSGLTVTELKWGDGEVTESSGYHHIESTELPFASETPTLTVTTEGTLKVYILPGSLDYYPLNGGVGGYVGISNLRVECIDNGGVPIMKTMRVKTLYNDKNNIALHRSVQYAPNPTPIFSHLQIRNGIYTAKDGVIYNNDDWKENETVLNLSTLMNQQLLAYYAKPNNILTGELITEDGHIGIDGTWVWNNTPHILTSGTLNILTGRIEGATLREFKRYDHMWETWVENEDVILDYPAGRVTFVLHSNKDLTHEAWKNVPTWVSPVGHAEVDDNLFLFDCDIMENASGQTRIGIFQIDTAWVRIIQRAAGDYGIDYGQDYS